MLTSFNYSEFFNSLKVLQVPRHLYGR